MKYKCKFCNRTFTRGKSLGGHMRAHHSIMKSGAKHQENNGFEVGFDCNVQSNYGLRDHPKKSFKGFDQQSLCEQCGKGFKSDKALFGHMRLHSNSGKEKCKTSSKIQFRYIIPTPVRKKRSQTRYEFSHRPCCSNLNESSCVSDKDDDDDEELRDIAVCMLMLSRGGFYSPEDTLMDDHDHDHDHRRNSSDIGSMSTDHNKLDFDVTVKNQLNSEVHCSESWDQSIISEMNPEFEKTELVQHNSGFEEANAYVSVSVIEGTFLENNNASYKLYDQSENSPQKQISCKICGKLFHSYKALRGHRLHCPVSRKRSSKKKAVKSSHTNCSKDELGSSMEDENQKIVMVETEMIQFGQALEDHMKVHFECTETKELLSLRQFDGTNVVHGTISSDPAVTVVDETIDHVEHKLCSHGVSSKNEPLVMVGLVSH